MMLLLGLALAIQGQAAATHPLPAEERAVVAVRAAAPPVLDGREDDPVWRHATALRDFLVVRPREGARPTLPTEARVAFDARNLYVFVRAFDPHPDSIIALLSRRDDETTSDQITVMIDSYHDRRSGYEFAVNPAGVKADYAIYSDGNEDVAWDGVWDVATRVDSLGWTAEYRIPLSQLRYPAGDDMTFGFMIWRKIARYTEQSSWPLYRQSQTGFVSQFGELRGLDGLATPRRAEFTPYLVTKSASRPAGSGYDRYEDLTVGGDLKYAVASNLTLNATVNPDFGQVEADPSVLNLSAFETYFRERRPFFVEGRGQFSLDVNCSAVNCSGEGLFYSRRIGRAPELADQYGSATSPTATRILGATKVTGRLPGGFALGVLDAVTQHETGAGGATIEPTTNYAVVRATQDYHGGDGSVGLMLTGVNRSLDQWSRPLLHRNAYVGAVDFRQRLFRRAYEVSGSVDLSRVGGSAAAIAQTQLSTVHNFQRPDGAERFDSTRTSLWGDAEEIRFGKVGGDRLHFETSYLRRDPGFEINDLGYLQQADQQSWNNWAGLRFNHPNGVYQRLNWNLNWWQYWSAAGLPTERAANTNIHTQLNNRWWLHLGGTLGQLGTTFCDRCARGGPALRQDWYISPWAGLEGDDRRRLVPYFWMNYSRSDGGRSHRINLSPEVDFKVSTRFTSSLSLDWTHQVDDAQWYGNFTDSLSGQNHYTFAHLNRHTLAATWRLNYTFTPNASLQLYAQPYVSKGTYSRIRELAAPRAARYADRFQPYTDPAVSSNPGGFNVQQFRSNVVFRWEYRPGSTLFVVWSQGRDGSADAQGRDSFFGDFRHLFGLHSNDTFLVKLSYWFNW